MKATDLLNLQFLWLPLHYNSTNYLRATTLACHLNQEAALLRSTCQHSAAASPAAHLHQDIQYSILRSAHSPLLYFVLAARCLLMHWSGDSHCWVLFRIDSGTDIETWGRFVLFVFGCVALLTYHSMAIVMRPHAAVSLPSALCLILTACFLQQDSIWHTNHCGALIQICVGNRQ